MENCTIPQTPQKEIICDTPYEYREHSKFYKGENFDLFYEGYKEIPINPSKEKKQGVEIGIVFKWGGEKPNEKTKEEK